MKPEDFLMALNDADDAYVKKAGIKGGYFTLHQETSNSNTEARGIPGNLHQETAKQRNFKRFCIAAAACLAVAALSWGTLALLRQSPMWGKNSPAGTNPTVGSNPTDGIAPSDAETTQPTEAASETVEPAKTIWVGAWEASCVAGEDAYDAVGNTVRKDPNLKAACSWQMEVVPMDEGEQAQLLEQAGTGKLSLQNGLGPKIAALAASEPEHVAVVCLRWVVFGSVTDTADIMAQTFFTVQGEDGSWRIVDATERQNADFMNISELDVTQLQALYGVYLNDESLTYTPGADANETLNSLKQAVHDLHPEVNLAATWGGAYGGSEKDIELQLEGFRTMQLQRGRNAEILEMLEAGAEEIEVIHFNVTFWNDNVEDASPSNRFSLQQLFFLSKNEDGLWEILDATNPKAVTDPALSTDASHEKMTGEMTEPVDLLAVDRGKVSLIWVGDWQASCIANDAPSKAVHSSLQEDPLFHSTSNYTMSTGILDEGEQAQLLEQARTGELSLQKGLGPELAALAASEPERVVVVRTRWIMCSKSTCHTEDTAMVQFFFTVQGEDGFWRIMDATDRQNEELPNLSEEDVAQMLEQYGIFLNGITYTPDADAYKTLKSMMENAHKLHPDTVFSHGSGGEQVSAGALKTLKLQNWKNADLTEMLEAGSKDITIISQEYSFTMDLDTADSIPRSFIIHQTFFLTKNADGLWEILDATYPE